jgi:protein-L-isoaspartate O-methyltransferase
MCVGIAATAAAERPFRYLAPPGLTAEAFPRPERPVAEIVGPSVLSEQTRDARDEVGRLARLLNLKPGMTVADIGAGNGYHTVRLARLLGPSGVVIAQDVTPLYLAHLTRRVERMELRNVTLALGEQHDPRLPAGVLDAAIIVHVYHEIAAPYAFLYNLAPAFKPGAVIAIVDFNRPIVRHGMPPNLLRCELKMAGYQEIALHAMGGDGEYVALFSAPRHQQRPRTAAFDPCSIGGG